MRLVRNLWITWTFVAWLSGASFAQCQVATARANAGIDTAPAPIGSLKQRSEQQDGTVLLELAIGNSGAVHKATVIEGPVRLRQAAVRVVKKHNYRKQMNVSRFEGQITVEVTFPQDKTISPQVHQVMPAGVGCLPVGEILPSPLDLWLLQPMQPAKLVLPPEATE